MDTIFAPATARGKAGVSVIRISGQDAFSGVGRMVRNLPAGHGLVLRQIRDLEGELLDEALVLTFPEGRSFTGEETVELQLHGSVAIVNAVLRCLSKLPGFKLAEPGQFTRRALENNRLDLTQVEGLADLVDAETEVQRRQAQRVLSGATGKLAALWRTDLVRAAALLEATIDFVDEEVPTDVSPEVLELIDRTLNSLRREYAGSAAAERVRDSFEVAIVGRPNVGKSTLLNALAGRDAAITSEIAGTTRDVIEVRMDIGGLPVTMLDTAGLRESNDVIEQIGVSRALARAADADLRIILVEREGDLPDVSIDNDDIVVVAKCDEARAGILGISGKTGQGLDRLMGMIGARLADKASGAGILIRERHRASVARGIESLSEARAEVYGGGERNELAAEHIRAAIRSLDSLVGRIGVEDVLGEIFSSFCLGK